MNHGQGTDQCYRHDNSHATQQSDQKQFCVLNSSEGHMLRLWGTHSALQLWSCYFILMGPFYFQIHTKLTTKFTIPSSVRWTDFPLSLIFRGSPHFSGCFLKNCFPKYFHFLICGKEIHRVVQRIQYMFSTGEHLTCIYLSVTAILQ